RACHHRKRHALYQRARHCNKIDSTQATPPCLAGWSIRSSARLPLSPTLSPVAALIERYSFFYWQTGLVGRKLRIGCLALGAAIWFNRHVTLTSGGHKSPSQTRLMNEASPFVRAASKEKPKPGRLVTLETMQREHGKDKRKHANGDIPRGHRGEDKTKSPTDTDRRNMIVPVHPPQSLSQALSHSIHHNYLLCSESDCPENLSLNSRGGTTSEATSSPLQASPRLSQSLSPTAPSSGLVQTSLSSHVPLPAVIPSKDYLPRVPHYLHHASLQAENFALHNSPLLHPASQSRHAYHQAESRDHHHRPLNNHRDVTSAPSSVARLHDVTSAPSSLARLPPQTVSKPSFLISDILGETRSSVRTSSSCFTPVQNRELLSVRADSPELDRSSVSDEAMSCATSPVD
ncbi:hypothetical protein BaRGS_00028457, partial [Batillaria attramentaria]